MNLKRFNTATTDFLLIYVGQLTSWYRDGGEWYHFTSVSESI